jgi:hypothetical protein
LFFTVPHLRPEGVEDPYAKGGSGFYTLEASSTVGSASSPVVRSGSFYAVPSEESTDLPERRGSLYAIPAEEVGPMRSGSFYAVPAEEAVRPFGQSPAYAIPRKKKKDTTETAAQQLQSQAPTYELPQSNAALPFYEMPHGTESADLYEMPSGEESGYDRPTFLEDLTRGESGADQII